MCSFNKLWLAYVSEAAATPVWFYKHPPSCRSIFSQVSRMLKGRFRAGSGKSLSLPVRSALSSWVELNFNAQSSVSDLFMDFYYWIQCVQLKLLIILTGGNHKMKADRMWSHQKALELSLSVVVLCFLSTQNLFGGKDIGSSMSNFVHLHLNTFLQCRVLNMVFPVLTGVCRAHADRWWPSGRPAECAWHQLCCGKPDIGMHHCIQLCTLFLKMFTIISH